MHAAQQLPSQTTPSETVLTETDLPESAPSETAVEPLTRSFSRVIRSAARMKQQFVTANGESEWAAHQLVAVVIDAGPMRASQLAEHVQADPSTISRHVAALIKGGLLERQIDPGDGRASLLAPTEKGRRFWDDTVRIRTKAFQLMLAGWNDDECRQVTQLLDRLADGVEACRPRLLAEAANRLAGDTGALTTAPDIGDTHAGRVSEEN